MNGSLLLPLNLADNRGHRELSESSNKHVISNAGPGGGVFIAGDPEITKGFYGAFFSYGAVRCGAVRCGLTGPHRTVRFCLQQNRTAKHRGF